MTENPMNIKIKPLTIAITSILFIISVGIVTAQTTLTSQAKVTVNGIGPIKVGMNLPEAAIHAKLYVSYAGNDSCYYLQGEGELKGISFMVTKDEAKSRQKYITSDVIARVDIDNPKVTTISGAKIGDSEAKIKSLYGGQIKVTPHEYNSNGHYLTFIPKERADKNYRVIFETDGKRVTRYRVGKLPEVEYVEGCS